MPAPLTGSAGRAGKMVGRVGALPLLLVGSKGSLTGVRALIELKGFAGVPRSVRYWKAIFPCGWFLGMVTSGGWAPPSERNLMMLSTCRIDPSRSERAMVQSFWMLLGGCEALKTSRFTLVQASDIFPAEGRFQRTETTVEVDCPAQVACGPTSPAMVPELMVMLA